MSTGRCFSATFFTVIVRGGECWGSCGEVITQSRSRRGRDSCVHEEHHESRTYATRPKRFTTPPFVDAYNSLSRCDAVAAASSGHLLAMPPALSLCQALKPKAVPKPMPPWPRGQCEMTTWYAAPTVGRGCTRARLTQNKWALGPAAAPLVRVFPPPRAQPPQPNPNHTGRLAGTGHSTAGPRSEPCERCGSLRGRGAAAVQLQQVKVE